MIKSLARYILRKELNTWMNTASILSVQKYELQVELLNAKLEKASPNCCQCQGLIERRKSYEKENLSFPETKKDGDENV